MNFHVAFSEGMPEYQISIEQQSIVIAIPDDKADVGRWSYEMTSRFYLGQQTYTINIISSSYRFSCNRELEETSWLENVSNL